MKEHNCLLSLGSFFLTATLVLADSGWQGQVSAQPVEPGPVVATTTSMPAQRFYIMSRDPFLKSRFEVRHQFPTAFSAVLTPREVEALVARGIAVKPVQIFHIVPKPGTVCGDGVCEPGENKNNCPADCNGGDDGNTGARSCYPENPTPWGIDRMYGDQPDYLPSGGDGVTVAVLDTGVNINHPDLKNRIRDCKDATKKGGIKSGCVDNHGHGTHVSGTILADGGDDKKGIFGVAPGAGLMAIKVCGNVFCWGDDIAAGIGYAAGSGANIISMSLGSNLPDSQVLRAIDTAAAKNVMVVAAAGNDGPAEGSIDYPGAYIKVVAAGAINQSGNVPDWSSRGINDENCAIEEKEVEFGAPGVNIESTYNDGCYTYMSGTSMATPHISGLAAKVWAGDVGSTRSYLQKLAERVCPTDKATGFGLPTISP